MLLTEKVLQSPFLLLEVVVRKCSVKKVFLEISQNSRENTCAKVATLLKKRLWHRYFPVNFAIFPRQTFFHRTPTVAASVLFVSVLEVDRQKLCCQLFLIRYPGSLWPGSDFLIWHENCFHVMCLKNNK